MEGIEAVENGARNGWSPVNGLQRREPSPFSRPSSRKLESPPSPFRSETDAWGPPGQMGRKSLGTTPALTPTSPLYEMPLCETDEEYADYYEDRISAAHNRQLYPLMEDLADWINKCLGECWDRTRACAELTMASV